MRKWPPKRWYSSGCPGLLGVQKMDLQDVHAYIYIHIHIYTYIYIDICIYIYPVGMRGGPDLIKNVAAREPAKSCEGARGESRRPKRYKNRGFETSRKMSKKVSFRRSGRPDMSENGKNGVFRFASGSLAALRFARFFWFWRSGRGAKIAKTLRFCGFRVCWRFWAAPLFVQKPEVQKSAKNVWV